MRSTAFRWSQKRNAIPDATNSDLVEAPLGAEDGGAGVVAAGHPD